MGQVTTHTEGKVVVTEAPDAVDVVQLPARDAAVQAATTKTPAKPAAAKPDAVKPTPAVKAATTQKAARIKKAKK